jgi:hypothetical protein
MVPGIKEVPNRAQYLRQRLRIELGSSTSAVRVAGQADLASGGMDNGHAVSMIKEIVPQVFEQSTFILQNLRDV